jgi:DNA-binding CsgD family transcriptional regulator
MPGAGGRRYGAIMGVSELPTGTVALLLGDVAAIRGDGRHVCRGRRVGPWGHRLPRRRLRGAALTVACRARRPARECGGAVSPALREAGQPLPLTAREREIISLVAQGLSNRQIADAMCRSITTVEGHLYRASLRSGAADRIELSALLRE